ncbi:MAG: recombinase family protein [Geminicoccaceae bacterium]
MSTVEQDTGAHRDKLEAAGAIWVFEDVISGRKFDRPGLTALFDHVHPGDNLCVVRLDRLGRSLKELLETGDELHDRQVNLISLEEKIDTTSVAGELIFHVFGVIAALLHWFRWLRV